LSRSEYFAAIEAIKERIRRGDTYQTNLTHQITVDLPSDFQNQAVFERLRQKHPAPFAAYIDRRGSTVISASPERFFRVAGSHIETSPIKGTRPRGRTPAEDQRMRHELETSEKDRAENMMIVDLLRNDLGRVCEYGSVRVRELCSVLELPTVFHLVSTIDGDLRQEIKPSDIIRALFPSGSITGAPKISTMKIIDELEPDQRGLSMGAIGVYIPPNGFDLPPGIDMSVAIRTMAIRNNTATFNVGGGITIDSDPECEYQESLIKAKALLDSLGVEETCFDSPEHFSTRVV
jgi:para-aminobenzoate synthetase component 1